MSAMSTAEIEFCLKEPLKRDKIHTMAVKAHSSVSLKSLPEAVKVQVLFRDGFICSLLQHYNARRCKLFLLMVYNSLLFDKGT